MTFLKNNLVQLPSIMGDLEDPDEFFNNDNGYVIEENENEIFDQVRNSFGKPTSTDLRRKSINSGRLRRASIAAGLNPADFDEMKNTRRSTMGGRRSIFGGDRHRKSFACADSNRKSVVNSSGVNESGFLSSDRVLPRSSVFYSRPDVEKDLDEDNLMYRRNTFAVQKQQRQVERFGLIKKIKNKHDLDDVTEQVEEKRTFKSLVQAIIRARRWNVPLYYGATEQDEKKSYNSPMDFDLSKFKSDSWACVTDRAKFLMTLEPWERSEADVDVIYRTVKRMKAFAKYSKQIKRELCRVVMLEQFGAGRIILQQGHYGVSMYFILKGSVSVQITSTDPKTGEKFTQIVSEIKAGSSFGELALVKDIRRTAAVVCKCDSEFLRLDRNDFDNVLRRSMEIEWNERMNQLKNLPYFLDWPLQELKTINIRSKIQRYRLHLRIEIAPVGQAAPVWLA